MFVEKGSLDTWRSRHCAQFQVKSSAASAKSLRGGRRLEAWRNSGLPLVSRISWWSVEPSCASHTPQSPIAPPVLRSASPCPDLIPDEEPGPRLDKHRSITGSGERPSSNTDRQRVRGPLRAPDRGSPSGGIVPLAQ